MKKDLLFIALDRPILGRSPRASQLGFGVIFLAESEYDADSNFTN